jgi:glycosyltransferase involved in cell wall biosynthesis
MLASAAVLVAPLNPSAGSFCVPSKILSYLCSGRPTVIAIDEENLAAKTILRSGSGLVVRPGDSKEFIKAVARLIDDPAFRLEAGSNARAYAEVNFNIDTIMETFIGILADAGVSLTPQVAAKSIHDLAHTAATV